jgi:hypothetical protein
MLKIYLYGYLNRPSPRALIALLLIVVAMTTGSYSQDEGYGRSASWALRNDPTVFPVVERSAIHAGRTPGALRSSQ